MGLARGNWRRRNCGVTAAVMGGEEFMKGINFRVRFMIREIEMGLGRVR